MLGRQTSRLATLIEGMLDVSRITAGRLALDRERLDLSTIVREEVTRREPEARRAGCELHTQLCPVFGTWDRIGIEQIASNLLGNAIKYGPGKPIEITVQQREDTAILSVRDFGIGIAPERLQHIFGRFERAVSLRAYGGLGLGLYITRQIVEAHGGRIEVESRPGGGSTFTVELPVEQPVDIGGSEASGGR